ncbi:beta-ketoacyl synthase N-terminal-like domain-containing protein [Actinomadura napierensis]|uniref:Beta-ketoacyl synthase-like N-terminal domain-containing protein n=1 Tax=Actinomadura napierensis TaxID=267854 RepID=A0ABN2ZL66_9ACTN
MSNACSASLYALALADDLLRLGRADTVVVAGVDTITESMFASLDTAQPSIDALRPFDARITAFSWATGWRRSSCGASTAVPWS